MERLTAFFRLDARQLTRRIAAYREMIDRWERLITEEGHPRTSELRDDIRDLTNWINQLTNIDGAVPRAKRNPGPRLTKPRRLAGSQESDGDP